MKIRVGHTQAVTKDITSRRDQRLAKVMLDMRRAAWPWERRSDKRSGVTLIVISTVLKRTPRKTMDIDGGLSLCGDDWTPRSRSKLSRAANASADLVGSSVPPESSLKFVQAELRELNMKLTADMVHIVAERRPKKEGPCRNRRIHCD